MAKLDLQEGDFISLRSVRLPKGEYLQLQPQLASWLDIPMATREAVYAALSSPPLADHPIERIPGQRTDWLISCATIRP